MLKKSLSQHLLKDRNLLDKLVRLSGIGKDHVVVEIGAGHGDLTRRLAAHAGFVYAIELDERFREFLEPLERESSNVKLIFGDALTIPLSQFCRGEKLKVIGNIPYHVTGDILFKLLEERACIEGAYLTMQREVAERIVSRPHTRAYGALSAILQLCARVKLLLYLKPGLFVPPPKVSSAFISIVFMDGPEGMGAGLTAFIKTCFRYKRKYLKHSLEEFYGKEKVESLYAFMRFAPAVRAEELEPVVFTEMYAFLN